MKFACRVSKLCLLFLCICFCTASAKNISSQRAFIFKPDGTTHCEPRPGIEIDLMELELSSKGISVFTKRKGHDGREGIALCGNPTGQINIFEIYSSDLSKAIGLGFRQLPTG